MKARDAPPYMHRCRGGLYSQIKTKGGIYVSDSLGTRDPNTARVRIVPVIKKLIAEEKLDPASRAARIYLKGHCRTCGWPFVRPPNRYE